MEKIYLYIGQIISDIQKVEECLGVLATFKGYKQLTQDKEITEKELAELLQIDRKTLGEKLKKLEEFKVFENKDDITILRYIKAKRNYLVHSFFLDNKFDSPLEIEKGKNELIQFQSDVHLILKALKGFTSDCMRNAIENK